MEKYKLYEIGSRFSEKEKEEAIEYLEKIEEKEKKFKNEVEKSEKDLEVIDLFKKLIKDYFKKLGIENLHFPDVSQIHFLKEKDFKEFLRSRQVPDEEIEKISALLTFSNQILVNADLPPQKRDSFLAHEMVHFVSYQAYNLSKEEKRRILRRRRTGYASLPSPRKKDKETYLFHFFNEAIVDFIAWDIRKLAEKDYHKIHPEISLKKIKKAFRDRSYAPSELLISNLVEEMKKAGYKEIGQEMKKGLVTGEMMYLRKIEKVFGKGALKELANLGYRYDEVLETAKKLGLKKAIRMIKMIIKVQNL